MENEKLFRGIPPSIVEQIIGIDNSIEFPCVVRFVKHEGTLEYTDFLPSHVDPNSKLNRNNMANKGGMANTVSQQVLEDLNSYSVSLTIPIERKEFENRIKQMKRHFPFVARGHTSINKGTAWNNRDDHVSYFLYDYVGNSPCTDFSVIDPEELWLKEFL